MTKKKYASFVCLTLNYSVILKYIALLNNLFVSTLV